MCVNFLAQDLENANYPVNLTIMNNTNRSLLKIRFKKFCLWFDLIKDRNKQGETVLLRPV